MYRHFEEYGNTLAENLSPSGYFDVDYYMAQKLAQAQKDDPTGNWNPKSLQDAFTRANLTAWDHYTKFGMDEGINPSPYFNTNDYMEAKLAQAQAVDPEGNWDMAKLQQAFHDAKMNPIEHWFEAGKNENLGNYGYTPQPEPAPAINYDPVALTADKAEYVGTDANEDFQGTVGGSNATLTQDTTIDGNGGHDMLTATLNGDFRGFSSDNPLTNVETVSLVNATKAPKMFNAQNISGVDTWNLDATNAPINLTQLAETGSTVNIKGIKTGQTTSIQFAPGANSDTDDAMTVGLENVGKAAATANGVPTYASISMNGIEDVTINSTGNANYANLAGISNANSLTFTGDADIHVNQASNTVTVVDGTGATGDIELDLSNVNNLKNAKFGAGDDSFKVGNVQATATLSGGSDGTDKVEIVTPSDRYQLNMDGIETLQLDGANHTNLRLSGENTSGLEEVILNTVGNAAANFGHFTIDNYDAGALTLTTQNNFGNNSSATVANISDVTLNIGNSKTTSETFFGTFRAAQATNLTINTNGTTSNADAFNGGVIIAPNVTALTINGQSNGDSVNFAGPSSGSNDLGNVSEIDVNGFADVDLRAVDNLGAKASYLNVDASGSNGDFLANFEGSNNASLVVAGSETGNNTIGISGNYSNIIVNTNVGDDTVLIDFSQMANNPTISMDLGSGSDTIYAISASAAQKAAIMDANPGVKWVDSGTRDGDNLTLSESGSTAIVGYGVTASIQTPTTPNGIYDFSNLQFTGSGNGITQDVKGDSTNNVANVTIGETGTNGANLTLDAAVTTLNLDLTEAGTKTTVDASTSSGGVTINLTDVQERSDVWLDLSGGQTDKVGLDTVMPGDQGGVWTNVFVEDLDTANDKIFSGAGRHFEPIWGDPEIYLSLAGNEGFSNVSRTNGGRTFQWTDADGETWTSGVVQWTDIDHAGRTGTLVSLAGVQTLTDYSSGLFVDGAVS